MTKGLEGNFRKRDHFGFEFHCKPIVAMHGIAKALLCKTFAVAKRIDAREMKPRAFASMRVPGNDRFDLPRRAVRSDVLCRGAAVRELADAAKAPDIRRADDLAGRILRRKIDPDLRPPVRG
jgi:hypothetical protein